MSLLTRLGRAADENRQVNIFGAREDTQDMAAERSYQEVKQRIHQRIVDEMTPEEQLMLTSVHQDPHQVETLITDYCQRVLDENPFAIPQGEKPRLIADIRDEVLGLGPIEALRKDDSITEIMVNGPRQVFVERMGKLELTDAKFHDTAHLMNIIERILTPLGRRVDESSPLVDARLEDGSRVNIIIPPLSLVGPCLTIRKFSKTPLSVDNLISFGTMDEKMATFLRACVKARINILVSGGTGSGKTTTLNVISSFIPEGERIVTIEDAAELRLQQQHVVTLEARPANLEGKGAITIRDLVRNALRMRPDRIIVGEVRTGEALDMLQAMNTGHDGSLTTLHANAPREAVERLVTMVRFAVELPPDAIEAQIGNALDLIVQTARRPGGARCISEIAEVSFDHGRRRCVVRTLYRWEVGQEAGFWLDYPQWVDRLAPMGLADRREVKTWMRSLDLRQSA